MTTATELRKLKVTELREKLTEKGLDTKGVKEDLIGRLLEAYENEGNGTGGAEEAPREEAAEVAQLETGDVKSEQLVENKISVSSEKPILTEAEKQKLRAERFGLLSTPASGGKEKKGEGVIGGLGMFNPAEEFERRKKRAERFGLPIPTLKAEEDARKKARAERFGIEVPLSKEEIEAKKQARAARFGIQDPKAIAEEEARKKEERAKRFAS